MPITFSIDAASNFVETTVTGPLRDTDLIEHLSQLIEHPSYQPGMSMLVSCSDVELGAFSSEAIRDLVAFSRSAQERLGGRVVIVASQPAVFGLARMYELLRSAPYELHVCRLASEAKAWLDRRTSAPC